ncbi:hypothetical protein ACP4OV_018169 [Aristida adscensionis]
MAPVVVPPRSDRMVRRTAMVGAATAAFLLLTADYGPNYPNPIRKAMESSPFFSRPAGGNESDVQGTTNSKLDGERRPS